MRAIYKALMLYLIVLAAMSLASRQPSFGSLAPISLPILLLGVIWFWRAEGHAIRHLGLQRVPSWRHNMGRGLLVGLILPLVLVTVQAVNGWITLAPPSRLMVSSLTLLLLGGVKIAFVVAVEELVFRGYFLQRFCFSLGTRLAVLLSSLLWAIGHLPGMVGSGLSPMVVSIGFVSWTVLGVALGTGFLRNENTLWLPSGLHYGYNFSHSLTGTLVEKRHHAPTWWVGDPAWAPESGLLGLLLAVAILAVVWWSTEQGRGSGY